MSLESVLITEFSEDDIPWEGGKHLFRLWNKKRGERLFPGRPDFHPVEMVKYLPDTSLMDIEQDPLRFRFRLVGTSQVDIMTFDATGQYADEISVNDSSIERWSWVARNQRPVLSVRNPLRGESLDYATFSSLVLPLGDTDEEVTMLIGNVNTERVSRI